MFTTHFTAHVPTSIRNRQTPLTLDQIRMVAPSAFAVEPYHGVSSRYAYIPTVDVIQGLMKAGFEPFMAAQSRTRIADKREYTKHLIRFRAPNTVATVGGTFPELVLVNGHDLSTSYKLMGGIFRLVCGNGMIVADSMIGSVNVRHQGNVIEAVTHGSMELVERMPKAIDAIARWQQIQLSQAEQTLFAEAAHTVRFADAEGKVSTPILPGQLLQARRQDDKGNDLWTTFNRIQENVIKGGLHAYKPGSFQRVSTRGVKGIDQDMRLNRALWTLGEKMAELRS